MTVNGERATRGILMDGGGEGRRKRQGMKVNERIRAKMLEI
jgi:hypothetical protein